MVAKATSEVFGLANYVLPDSYIDRGELDQKLQKLLKRPTHIALRGESKCGKSWIRQRNIPDAIVVQCRLKRTVIDLYQDALSQLQIRLTVSEAAKSGLKGTVSATGSFGEGLLAKLGFSVSASGSHEKTFTESVVGHDINDLRYIAEIIANSGKRLVIEDFHYLSTEERRSFAFDLKALWDYGLYVIIIGVWSQSNMLLYLNPDLSGRIREEPIFWNADDLRAVLEKGGNALAIEFSEQFKHSAIDKCYENVGILQYLTLETLDLKGIEEEQTEKVQISDTESLETAAMEYAEQLNPLYMQFAERVSKGIRHRADSTDIYAHTMAVVLNADDEALIRGLHIDQIFQSANSREPRIQKGNLRKILERLETLQVDSEGRGLVLAYDEQTSHITVVDRQMLLYRRYSTVKWPWEGLIADESSEQRQE